MTGWLLLGAAFIAIAVEAGVENRRVNGRWRAERERFEIFDRGLTPREASLRPRPHGQGVQGAPTNPPQNHKHPALLAEADRVRGGERYPESAGKSTP